MRGEPVQFAHYAQYYWTSATSYNTFNALSPRQNPPTRAQALPKTTLSPVNLSLPSHSYPLPAQ